MQMRAGSTAVATALVASLGLQQLHHSEERKGMSMNVTRITAVLFVQEIEPVLPFWVEQLGFTKTIEVPQGNKIGFVALQKGSTEVMYQSYASVAEDVPLIAETRKGPTFLYIEVDNLDAVLNALKSSKIVQPERTAFYGMREVGFQEPGGHYVTFAQPVAAAQH
jgi:glyoxalase/bleomycin resistance protein/dioxygenase superfamily protein